uniref:Uncharacterized protein n=1 Tax=Kuetzingia canaliculata TaxID=228262 RepID=A0A1Z1MQ04_KUECA|nr:hypothetical protein [Kuetzingia canaliculata]ARW67855.1 hypothetical protein [Kuetzingia canaliculata]
MNLLESICSYYYIKSHLTLMHRIKDWTKIIITFFAVSFMPCLISNQDTKVLNINIINIITISLFRFLKREYIIIVFIFIIYNCYITDHNKIHYNLKLSTIYLPYDFNLTSKVKIKVLYKTYYLPFYIKKAIFLNSSQFIIFNILYKFTKSESVYNFFIKNLISIIKIINLNQIRWNISIMIIYLSIQVLEKIYINIKNIQLSIKIKYRNQKKYYYFYYIKLLAQICYINYINLIDNLNYNTTIIWNRNIKYKDFSIACIRLRYMK